ncbi:MAG TPA: hypothetical protein ENF92_04780 [Desulfobacteraceae bacterium]|nr:hypothetical protein [Desulfobacteraceae bacterium]
MFQKWSLLGILFSILVAVNNLLALSPEEILVIANKNDSKGVGIAKYYMKRRGIPNDHLLQIWITDKETFSREDYDRKVIPMLLDYLKDKNRIQGRLEISFRFGGCFGESQGISAKWLDTEPIFLRFSEEKAEN